MDIASVATIENTSNTNNPPSIEENKTTSLAKGTKSNEDNINVSERKSPEEDRFIVSYDEMNIEDNFIKKIEHGTEIVFKTTSTPPLVTLGFAVSRNSNKINVFN